MERAVLRAKWMPVSRQFLAVIPASAFPDGRRGLELALHLEMFQSESVPCLVGGCTRWVWKDTTYIWLIHLYFIHKVVSTILITLTSLFLL